jgi:hypothetical protein
MVWLNLAESTSFKTLFLAMALAPVLTNRSASTMPQKKTALAARQRRPMFEMDVAAR